MTEFNGKTAILVFIRSETEEAEAKTFSHSIGKKGNRSVVRQLNKNIIREAEESNLPTFVLPGTKQVGGSFGARLADGFERIFEKGFDRVIAVGNDCLEVNRSLLLDAENQLNRAAIVLGPTYDGGTYLIGLSKKAFKKELFIQLDWETDKLFEDLISYSKHLLFQEKITLLKKADDIDNAADFQKAFRQLPLFCPLRKQLENILAMRTFYQRTSHLIPSFFVKTTFRLRAPPAAAF